MLRQRQETLDALDAAHRAQALLEASLAEQRHIATTLQRSLMPSELPMIPGATLNAHYWPAMAGLYDVFALGGDRWGIVIGDVCGKGVAAAALTATARHSARAAATHVEDPSDVLRWVYEAVVAQVHDRFLTMAYATLELDRSGGAILNLALGGHPHPFLVGRDGEVRALGRFGTLIGMTAVPSFHTTTIAVAPGDLMLFYTDGLTDAPDDRALDDDELSSILAAHRSEALDVVATAIRDALEARSGGDLDDDAALLLIRVGNA